jgi:hypothetical protein
MSEMKKATEALRPKFDGLNEIVPEMIKDDDQNIKVIRECEVRCQGLGNKLQKGNERQRKINIINFVL